MAVAIGTDFTPSQLNTPEHDVNGGDEVNQATGPFVQENELVVPNLNEYGMARRAFMTKRKENKVREGNGDSSP